MIEGSNFCSYCGNAVRANECDDQDVKIIYAGRIHKCPNCGEVVDAFSNKCVFCNYEIRERNVSETLQKFCIELSESQNESEKASYIRNYPIPNSKEDILEFMILASSNINGESNITVFEAWSAKLEQAYQKAKMVFQEEASFERAQEIYLKHKESYKKEKAMHSVGMIRTYIKNYFAYMKNPFVAIVLILLLILLIADLVRGDFEYPDFLRYALLFFIIYQIRKKFCK